MADQAPSGRKRHFLPAGSTAYFSYNDTLRPLRRRPVCVLRKGGGEPYINAAENVGFVRNLYGYNLANDIDDYFKGSEKLAHDPVDQLVNAAGPWAPFRAWSSVAWYITCLFVREPDSELNLNQFIVANNIDPNSMQMGYPLNAQRIAPAILRARWRILLSHGRNFILGDRGFAGLYEPSWHMYGYLLPVRKNVAILLGAGPYQKRIRWSGDQWEIQLEYQTIAADYADGLNTISWHASRAEVYGPDKSQLLAVRQSARLASAEVRRVAPLYSAAGLLGLTDQQRRAEEMLIFTALGLPEPSQEEIENGLELMI